jgi:short-subunit dehydrogenase
MSSVVLGATAGVGRALAEALAIDGDDIVLVASDRRDLDAMAAHLRHVHACRVDVVVIDATRTQEAVDALAEFFGDRIPDRLFFPIGASRHDDQGALGVAEITMLLNTNLAIVVAVVAHFLPGLMERGEGSIVGFGSIAAVRGRGSNAVYAAAKRGLESYFESLRHITSKTDIEVSLYRLGYVDSQQSFGQQLIFPKVTAPAVAAAALRGLGGVGGLRSFPAYWRLIGLAVALVPWPVFKRLRF